MSTNTISLKNYNQASRIICLALIIGQLFFLGVAVYLVQFSGINFEDTRLNDVFIYVVPFLALSSISASFVVFKGKMLRVKEITDIPTKLTDYRAAQIIRWALYEGPSFFAIIAYMLTGQLFYIGIVAIVIVLFIMSIPSKARFEIDLELSWEEKSQLAE